MVIAPEGQGREEPSPARRYTQTVERARLDEAVLRLLACPVCRAALEMPAADALRCTGCGRRYPVRDGLPVLIAEAAIEPSRQ